MRKVVLSVALALLLAECGSANPNPVVDMQGVGSVKYNRDLADCVNNQPFLALGNPVSACMRAKGYKILVNY
jgi:uncharacterized protein YcfL